jgi:hypothetical protein
MGMKGNQRCLATNLIRQFAESLKYDFVPDMHAIKRSGGYNCIANDRSVVEIIKYLHSAST